MIRNTVRRVQETAALLRAAVSRGELPKVEVIVAHSRFLALDRAKKDSRLLDLYGPKGDRPTASIVVASQVIEQSLDLDFDLMVSDLAPIDLLMQRTGRLHRHARDTRPAPLRTPQARHHRSRLERDSAGARPRESARLSAVSSPADARDARRPYLADPPRRHPRPRADRLRSADVGPTTWTDAIEAARKKFEENQAARCAAADEFRLGEVRHGSEAALLGWVHGGAGDPSTESRAQGTVRDGDPTLEVVVLQRGADGVLRTPDWLTEAGALPHSPPHRAARAQLTRTILGCVLRLPAAMCHGTLIDRHITALERAFDLPPVAREPCA